MWKILHPNILIICTVIQAFWGCVLSCCKMIFPGHLSLNEQWDFISRYCGQHLWFIQVQKIQSQCNPCIPENTAHNFPSRLHCFLFLFWWQIQVVSFHTLGFCFWFEIMEPTLITCHNNSKKITILLLKSEEGSRWWLFFEVCSLLFTWDPTSTNILIT